MKVVVGEVHCPIQKGGTVHLVERVRTPRRTFLTRVAVSAAPHQVGQAAETAESPIVNQPGQPGRRVRQAGLQTGRNLQVVATVATALATEGKELGRDPDPRPRLEGYPRRRRRRCLDQLKTASPAPSPQKLELGCHHVKAARMSTMEHCQLKPMDSTANLALQVESPFSTCGLVYGARWTSIPALMAAAAAALMKQIPLSQLIKTTALCSR